MDVSQFEAEPGMAMLPPNGITGGLRLLCISAEEPSWITLTLHLDAAGCHEPQFRWCSSAADALALLRDESFDCVLLYEPQNGAAVLHAIRAGGSDEPVVWIGKSLNDGEWREACQLDCEVLISPHGGNSPALAAFIERAIRRAELVRENHRLSVAHHRRLLRERDEAAHLLTQQRQMIQELADLHVPEPETPDPAPSESQAAEPPPSAGRLRLPAAVSHYYHELLRTYVIMGSGNLGAEIARLAELVCTAELSPREVLELHLERVESLVRGLGNRSTRHVMARADLLALELMMHMGEYYRSRGR